MRTLLLAVVLMAGCKDKAGPASVPAPAPAPAPALPASGSGEPSDEELLAIADRTLAFQDDLSRAGEAAGTDCAEMARRLDVVVDANAELRDPERVKRLEPHAERFDRMVNEHRAGRLQAVLERQNRALKPCADDPRVTAALARLDLPAP